MTILLVIHAQQKNRGGSPLWRSISAASISHFQVWDSRAINPSPQQSILNLIPGCSFSFRQPFVTACWTHDPTEARLSPSAGVFSPLFSISLDRYSSFFRPAPETTVCHRKLMRELCSQKGARFICHQLAAIDRSHPLIIQCNEIM